MTDHNGHCKCNASQLEIERLRTALQAIKYIYDEILAVRLPISGEHPMGVIARDALAGLEIVMGEPTATPSRSPSDSRDRAEK